MLQLDKYEVVPILLTFVGIGSVAVLLSLIFYYLQNSSKSGNGCCYRDY